MKDTSEDTELNFLGMLIIPNYIEDQEKQGQEDLVHSDELPIRGFKENILTAFGFTFAKICKDSLFRPVTFPAGWTRRATDHSMWSEVLDEKGRKRISVFYKAAFYDRDARMHFCSRYNTSLVQSKDGKTPCSQAERNCEYSGYAVFDGETILFCPGFVRRGDWAGYDKLRDECDNWLDEHFPDWKEVTAYWD